MAGLTLAGSRRVGLPLVGAAAGWAAAFVVLGALQTPVAAYVLLPLAGVWL